MTTAHHPDDPIDAAVRTHLEAEAAKVDARQVLDRVKARQASARSRATALRRGVRWATLGAAATAAGLLLALFLTGNTAVPPREASAEELVLEAKAVHESAATDRCYQVTADGEFKPGPMRIPPARSATVWTRGDQFVVLSAVDKDGPPWAWGQQADGRVWLAPNRFHAIVFDKDELNDPLARFCELMSLRLATTLGEVLEKYDLFRKDAGEPGEPIRIEATLRPGLLPGARVRKIELELDPNTKAVRTAVLHRYLNGQPEGSLRFTLTETTTKPADFYSLEGHTSMFRAVHDGKPMVNPPPPQSQRAKLREELLKKWQERQK
jgi:hypothetical protein